MDIALESCAGVSVLFVAIKWQLKVYTLACLNTNDYHSQLVFYNDRSAMVLS